MKVKSGNMDLLTSGVIIPETGKPIEIKLGDEDNLTTTIYLIQDPNKGNFKMEAKIISNNHLELSLINFITKGVGGGGGKNPIKLGTFQHRALYLSFIILSISSEIMPVFHFNFYLGEGVEDVK
jgi:hypothetical protein